MAKFVFNLPVILIYAGLENPAYLRYHPSTGPFDSTQDRLSVRALDLQYHGAESKHPFTLSLSKCEIA